MTPADAELIGLFVREVERHLERLSAPEVTSADVRAILHSLKGSAAMARQHDLATVVSQLKSRYQSGEPEIIPRIVGVLTAALDRLRRGQAAFSTAWPEPPPELGPAPVSPTYRDDYLAAMRDRVTEVDAALS